MSSDLTSVPSSLLDPQAGSLLAATPDAARRLAALATAQAMTPPTVDSEDWRYSRIEDLDLRRFALQVRPVVGSAPDPLEGIVTQRAATVEVVNGFISLVSLDAEWAARGLQVGPATDTAQRSGRAASEDPTIFDALHLALAPEAVRIVAPAGLIVDAPIVILSHQAPAAVGEAAASFPHISVEVGDNASLTVLEYQTSTDGSGLSAPLVELAVGPSGRLAYATVQNLATGHWQVGRQVSTVAQQGTLTSSCASFGGSYGRLRFDTTLAGRGAHGDLIAVYYGDHEQMHDFRTFQHHSAQDTTSDLLFKGVVDDHSASVYTGLIHIHPEGRGSNAHQTNRNIKLSDDAWAWSVPNLEIENSDVRCSHASAVSPIDDEQRFYLHARGVPPIETDQLIIAGFFEDVITRMPPSLHDAISSLVSAKLARRLQGDQLQGDHQ